MAVKQKFFSNAGSHFSAPPSQEGEPLGYVDVEGSGDYGFRTLAAALIELLLLHPLMNGRDELLGVLVTRHEAIFQASDPITRSSVSQRWLQLLKRVPLNQLIPDVGYTLRQIAVDELCANPAIYPDAFVSSNATLAPQFMRKAHYPLDVCAIAALSNRLNVPITINRVDGCRTLPKQQHYNIDGIRPSLRIQLDNGRYMPYLSALRAQIVDNMVWSMSPMNQHQLPAVDRCMDDILRAISDDELYIKQQFASVYSDLKQHVSSGALDKADLIAIYASGVDRCPDLKGLRHSADLESGTQCFFEKRITYAKDVAKDMLVNNHDEYIVCQLIYAIARAISLGYMSPSVIYKDNIDMSTRHVFR